MILAEFAKYLQEKEREIIQNRSASSILVQWLKIVLHKKPKTNTEKVVHAEISLAENKIGDYLLVAKSETGRNLMQALYNFALSYEQHVLNKWLQDKKASDFKN